MRFHYSFEFFFRGPVRVLSNNLYLDQVPKHEEVFSNARAESSVNPDTAIAVTRPQSSSTEEQFLDIAI